MEISEIRKGFLMSLLVLLRHGQSVWNLENRFTGFVDVPLSPQGIQEALSAGEKISDILFDVGFTSHLERASHTLALAMSKSNGNRNPIFIKDRDRKNPQIQYTPRKTELPVYQAFELNERNYGDLQGKNKQEAREKYGDDQVHIWRRSYDTPPNNGESLKDTLQRSWPYFQEKILPELQNGKNVLVSAHGNSLRAIIKELDGISDKDITSLEIPTGIPIIYEYQIGNFIKK